MFYDELLYSHHLTVTVHHFGVILTNIWFFHKEVTTFHKNISFVVIDLPTAGLLQLVVTQLVLMYNTQHFKQSTLHIWVPYKQNIQLCIRSKLARVFALYGTLRYMVNSKKYHRHFSRTKLGHSINNSRNVKQLDLCLERGCARCVCAASAREISRATLARKLARFSIINENKNRVFSYFFINCNGSTKYRGSVIGVCLN